MFEGFAPAQRQCSAQQWAVHSALMARPLPLLPPRSRLNRTRTLTLIPRRVFVRALREKEAIEATKGPTKERDWSSTSFVFDCVARGTLNCSSSIHTNIRGKDWRWNIYKHDNISARDIDTLRNTTLFTFRTNCRENRY